MPPEEWGLLSLDPELLEGLPENEYRELCDRLRKEQVKRWNSVNENNRKLNAVWIKTVTRKPNDRKHVTFMLDSEGNPKTFVCGQRHKETDFKYISKINLDDYDEGSSSGTSSREPSPPYENDHAPKPLIPAPPPRWHLDGGDDDDEEERLNQLLLETRLHIYNSEREQQRERDAWLTRKKMQLKERQDRDKMFYRFGSSSSLSSSPSPPSSPLSTSFSASPDYSQYQDATALARLINRPESPEIRVDRICEIAKRARSQNRRILEQLEEDDYMDLPTVTGSLDRNRRRPTVTVIKISPTRPAIVDWFQKHELPRGAGIDPQTNQIAAWFHGIISRSEAERQLAGMPVGSYLVRVSEKIWGYAISYRTYDRFRHFLIHVSNGRYQLLGSGHLKHPSLADLVKYHRTRPISKTGKEYLLHPCPQASGVPDYLELFGESQQGRRR